MKISTLTFCGPAIFGIAILTVAGCIDKNIGPGADAAAALAPTTPVAAAKPVPDQDEPKTETKDKSKTAESNSTAKSKDKKMNEKAVLAGGCFWGMQELIRKKPGIISTRVGYTGGNVPNATYRNHGTHAEAIEIEFDPTVTSYRKILEFFFQIHDPTTANRQGNDIGASYRSAIYYTSEKQKEVAVDTIADVNASGLWPGKVVTEVEAAGPFWEAEAEHQDYLQRIPNGYTCHFARPGWVLPKRDKTKDE